MTIQSGKDRVVIAVDPHKASWTAVAVDASLQRPASIHVPVPPRLSRAAPFRPPMAQLRLGDRWLMAGRMPPRLTVFAPGASYITAAFEHQEVIVTGLIEADRGSQPRIAAADDGDIDVAGSG